MISKAHFIMIAVVFLSLASWASAQESKGYLKLATSEQVGNTVLRAGEYEVVHRISPTSGHYIEFSGSARELVETGILGCFPESHEFSPGHRHALGLEQQVMQIFVAAPAP